MRACGDGGMSTRCVSALPLHSHIACLLGRLPPTQAHPRSIRLEAAALPAKIGNSAWPYLRSSCSCIHGTLTRIADSTGDGGYGGSRCERPHVTSPRWRAQGSRQGASARRHSHARVWQPLSFDTSAGRRLLSLACLNLVFAA